MQILILFVSILLFAQGKDTPLEKTMGQAFQKLDFQNMFKTLSTDSYIEENAGSECFDALQKYANRFEQHAFEIALMTLYSGRDLNDLGRFDDCNALEFTRYISLSIRGLPIGIFLGICGPVE